MNSLILLLQYDLLFFSEKLKQLQMLKKVYVIIYKACLLN